MITFKALHLFCGIGGGSKGFSQSKAEFMGNVGNIENLLGIDSDPGACENYEIITGSKASCMDLFSRDQYTKFHGQEPPSEWEEVTPFDIWKETDGIAPDIVFTSPPCKGFSGLLPEKSAKTQKYQALNQLTVRGIKLCLDAFEDDLPSLFLLENVPRITSRGKSLLDEITRLLESYGYAVDGQPHECGEIGGLGQIRKRYLLIARNEKKMPAFVYQPPKKKLKTIGDVIINLPMPDDELGGPMHRLPRLQWKTWVRLALIPAGGDWRDLENIAPEEYCLTHEPRGSGNLGVQDWDKTGHTVIGKAKVGGSNAASISDPRTRFKESTHHAIYRVQRWEETANTITGAHRPNNGAPCIADPRLNKRKKRYPGLFKVQSTDDASSTIIGQTDIQCGALSISDPRVGKDGPKFNHAYKVSDWKETGGTVAGGTGPSSGATCISDPRLNCSPRSGTMGVMNWNETAKTVIGSLDVHAGTAALADPRIPEDKDRGIWIIIARDGTWHRPMTTYELAMLQSFSPHLPDGRPFQLTGKSDAKWREWIGNAVPPDAAESIGNVMLISLLASKEDMWILGETDIWVMPDDVEKGECEVS
jgi:site-specific DNA-cytosine methylase